MDPNENVYAKTPFIKHTLSVHAIHDTAGTRTHAHQTDEETRACVSVRGDMQHVVYKNVTFSYSLRDDDQIYASSTDTRV